MTFADRLRALRRAAGLTQEELAERAGLTVHGVSSLERGTRTRPYPHTVRALAVALGLDDEQLAELRRAGTATDATSAGTTEADADPGDVARVLRVPQTQLVGRDADVAALLSLLERSDQRLVTLTGPGGVGKTRLAVEVATAARHLYPGGVFFVALAPLADPALVESVIAAGLRTGAGRPGGLSPAAGTAGRPPARRMLVLDNFEHLLDTADCVTSVLAADPGLTALVTSRARLRLRGETEIAVAPLGLPASTRRPAAAEVSASAAGRLFEQRARDVRPDFEITDATAADVAAICWRLAGLPLAVELAAAKTKILPPAVLLDRLDDALSTGWARDLPPRQHTLRTTLDWSYRLLDDDARALLRQLSVFAGGFDLSSAEAVAGPVLGGSPRVLASLEALVEHSLVTVVNDPGHDSRRTQYTLLEPVRQYARELLRESGREPDAERAHAAHFLAVAERAVVEYHGYDQIIWLERTDAETDNLRAAMRWALAARDAESAGRLGWALWQAWWHRGRFDEGRRLVEAALGLDLPAPWRNRLLVVHASLCDALGELSAAERSWTDALAVARSTKDVVGQAYGTAGLGLASMADAPNRARDLLRDAVRLAESAGADWPLSMATIWLGTLEIAEGRIAEGTAHLERALTLTRPRGDRMLTSVALLNLARAALAEGRCQDADAALAECLELATGMRTRVNLGMLLMLSAATAAARNRWQRCALLLGAAQRASLDREASIHHSYLVDQHLQRNLADRAERALGPAAYGETVERGRQLRPEDAVRSGTDDADDLG